MTAPYYTDGTVTLHHGDMREVLPALNVKPDLIVADPPYGETSLAWDRWPGGWPSIVAEYALSMWCFGSMRMFLDHRDEFTAWKLSQDAVWRKSNGSSFAADRLRRVHEHALHWYRGAWSELHHDTPRVHRSGPKVHHGSQGQGGRQHTGAIGVGRGWSDDGTRLMQSVIDAPSMWRRGAIHPTEKPVELLDPLIRYACPPGGLVLDPFAGSGSTAEAARLSGRRTVLIEAHEPYCEAIARRMQADVLPLEMSS